MMSWCSFIKFFSRLCLTILQQYTDEKNLRQKVSRLEAACPWTISANFLLSLCKIWHKFSFNNFLSVTSGLRYGLPPTYWGRYTYPRTDLLIRNSTIFRRSFFPETFSNSAFSAFPCFTILPFVSFSFLFCSSLILLLYLLFLFHFFFWA